MKERGITFSLLGFLREDSTLSMQSDIVDGNAVAFDDERMPDPDGVLPVSCIAASRRLRVGNDALIASYGKRWTASR
jgi:hypothetical protein